jgi:hypothetical protein
LKKFLALAFSALLILGFAASAFAIHAEIPAETTAAVSTGSTLVTIGGNLRTRYEFCQSCETFDDDGHDHWKRWDARGRMNFTIKVAENATGFVSWQNGWNMGDQADGAAGTYSAGNRRADGGAEILQTWIQYTGLGPLSFKVGHMPLALGNHMFFSHTDNGDDALLIYADPAEGVHVAFIYDLFTEGDRKSADTAEAYVLLGTLSTDTFNLGGDVTWVNDNTGVMGTTGVDLYNIAARGDMTFGGVNVYADVNFQTGSAEVAGAPDSDFGGFAGIVGGKFKAGGMNLGAEFGYGTGDDPTSTSTDIDTYIQSVNARVQYRTFIYSTRTPTTAGPGGAWTSNIMWLAATAGGPITDALSFKAGLYWLTAAEDTAICPQCSATIPTLEDEVGIELDASVNYQLARNLRLWAEGGYLLAGDAFQKEDPVSGLVRSGDDAYGIRLGTEMSF